MRGPGHAGKTCKEVKFKSREATGSKGKGMKEREGQGDRWPAVSRQRANPHTGRDRAAGLSPE